MWVANKIRSTNSSEQAVELAARARFSQVYPVDGRDLPQMVTQAATTRFVAVREPIRVETAQEIERLELALRQGSMNA